MRYKIKNYDTAVSGMWWGWNYGAVLTSYALFNILKIYGLHPIMLDHAPMSETWSQCTRKNTPFRSFVLNEKMPVYSIAKLKDSLRLNKYISIFIVGSDQLWRYQYIREFGMQFFLDYVDGYKQKISYSTSLGTVGENVPKRFQEMAHLYLSRFNAISVREYSAIEELKRIYNIDSQRVMDPIFLHNSDFWKKTASKSDYKIDGHPYIFSYILDPSPLIPTVLNKFDNELYKRVLIGDYEKQFEISSALPTWILLRDATVYRWLQEIQYCQLMITDSFHGVCFAILFNKPFICLINNKRGATRFHTLIKLFPDLKHRFISNINDFPDNFLIQDYTNINKIIETERTLSKNWLSNALNSKHSICIQVPPPIQPCKKPGKLRLFISHLIHSFYRK